MVLVALYASHRSSIWWCSLYGMVNFLYRPLSMLKKPDPRRESRLPVCPSMVSWKDARAAVGLAHRFGPLVPETAGALWVLMIDGTGTPLGVANELSCQSVDQREPSPTENGRPDVRRNVPVTTQPPTKASRTRPMLLPNSLPRPKGSCQTR